MSNQARPSRCECGASYAEAIGYCRCVAAPLTCDPSFEFRDALLAHLAAKEERLPSPATADATGQPQHLRFQFARDVRDEPSLRDAATRVVLAARASSGSVGSRRASGVDSGVTREAAAAADGGVSGVRNISDKIVNAKVLELLRAVMFSLHRDGAVHFSDKAQDVYVLVSRGRVLQPSLEAVCRERGLGLAQENEIIRALQSTALFHHVSGARIRACINRMKSSRPEGGER